VKVELRDDYQVPAVDAARVAIREGARNLLINSPTGSGKSVMGAALLEMVMLKGKRANLVVDRLSLVNQWSELLDRYGIEHGVIQSSHPRYRPSLPLQLCSVQTLAKRGWPDADLNMIDECHVVHSTVAKQLESGRAITIGLTATPMTRGLGKHYQRVINVTTTRWLIDKGWLKPYRIFSCAEPDMRGVKVTSGGEWDEGESSKKALEVVGDVVQEYLKHGEGRKFICSAVDTAHVQELTRQFLAAGINVAPYTYKELAEDRDDITREFRKHDSAIRGVVTVTAASRGWDVPSVNCIIMARPLRKSVAEHLQLMGRGLRPYEGQSDCLVLDHSGNCARLFWQTEDFIDNGLAELDDGSPKPKPKKLDKPEAEPVKCPSCGHLHKPMPHCPACGFQYERKQSVQHVPGSLRELIVGGHTRELTRDIWPQVARYALDRRNGDSEAARRFALAVYRDMVGDWPKAKWENTKPSDTVTPEVLNKIRSLQIRFAKRRVAAEARA
jgi:DNA repair protein RadD